MEIRKITAGYVIQRWDAESKTFIGQEFIAGDDITYEDEFGDVIDEEEPEYRCFEMVQNPETGFTL